jgi:hypothetical protein
MQRLPPPYSGVFKPDGRIVCIKRLDKTRMLPGGDFFGNRNEQFCPDFGNADVLLLPHFARSPICSFDLPLFDIVEKGNKLLGSNCRQES